jgi:chorismate synthase
MSGNTFGTFICVTSFGESHGPAYGGVVDGCPPGLELAAADIAARARPAQARQRRATSPSGASRIPVEILSGVFEGRTTGTPIGFLMRNEDQRSKDYAAIARSSARGTPTTPTGRSTACATRAAAAAPRRARRVVRVAAGAIAKKWLGERYGVRGARLSRAARCEVRSRFRDWATSTRTRSSRPTRAAVDELERSWTRCARAATPAARASTWWPSGVPVGWGEPVYGRLDADIAAAMMSINAVKGVEIGAGFAAVEQKGSEHGDEMTPQGFLSNHNGGVLGGISTGQDITVSIALKPTSSIRASPAHLDTQGSR